MKTKLVFSLAIFLTAFLLNSPISVRKENLALAAGPDLLDNNIENGEIAALSATFREQAQLPEKFFSARKAGAQALGGLYPLPELERTRVNFNKNSRVHLNELPKFESNFNGRVAGLNDRDEFVFYTIDKKLQAYTKSLVKNASAPHVAIVAMDPSSGRILAIAEKSNQIKELSLHAGFPAASLFKIITTAAALDAKALEPSSMIRFRGGTYTLNRSNYLADRKRDVRALSLTEALGMSCNPAFARVALQHLSPQVLRRYSEAFGFNSAIEFEVPMDRSLAEIPDNDYELSRTAAGFGNVRISPVHAAAFMSGIANDGLMPKPYIVNHILSRSGTVQYQARPQAAKRVLARDTANTLMQMLESTTTVGTSRNEFYVNKKRVLPYSVAGKTGTLSGNNPKGLNQWFIAAAPIDNPKIAVSVISVSPAKSNAKASRLGRQVIQKYLADL